MCDASDFAMGAIIGHSHNKIFHPMYYASKSLVDVQINYTTIENELLVVVYINHAAIKYLIDKKDAKPRFWSDEYC